MQVDIALKKMHSRVSEILFYVWDPIGINTTVSCRYEYENYVPIVSAYLLNRYAEEAIDALLLYIMEEYIGVRLTVRPRRKYQHLKTLRMLIEWTKDFKLEYPDARDIAPRFPDSESFLEQIEWSRRHLQVLTNSPLKARSSTKSESN